ncbi:MAG: Gldg family protein [Planctomyces sp.]|nr:Gldg family protein [Planctomyces sp.]
MFRAHVVTAVWKRNVASYFSGVLGFLFIAVFVAAASVLAFSEQFFIENQCNLDQLTAAFPYLLLFIVPAVTMSIWADERKLGTDELLFTLPASDFEILLGKYLSALTVYSVALLFSGTLTFVLAALGQPDWRVLATTYFGYWLAGGALIAAGMFASVLTSSVTVAFILGVLFSVIPVFADRIAGWALATLFGIREPLSVGGQLRDFAAGLVPAGGLAYFLGIAAFFLYLNLVMITRRHWASGRAGSTMTWQFVVRGLCLALVVVSASYVLAMIGGRADLTSERLYTLSDATRKAIAAVNPERPVLLQAYVSPRVPEDYVRVRKDVLALLRQYQKLGGRRLDVRIVDTEPYSEQAEEALNGGIQRREVVSERGGRFTRDDIYLGVAVSSGLDRVVIPYFEKTTPVEFELTRAIGTVSREKRPTVGVLATDAKLMGGFDAGSFRSQPEWRLVQELRKQYTVTEISPGSPIADDACDVLIAVLPSSLTQPEMNNLVAYVKRGRPVLIFDDPAPIYIPNGLELAPSNRQKPSQGGGMFGGGAPGAPKADGGEALSLMEALGVTWNVHEVLYDFVNPHLQIAGVVPKTFLFVTAGGGASSSGGLNVNSPITNGLQEVLVAFGGRFREKPDSKFEVTPLLRSRQGSSGVVEFEQLFRSSASPFGGGREFDERVIETQVPDGREHVIAAQIRSTEEKSPINAIFIADIDLVSNQMYQFWESETAGLSLDNILFVYNCIDTLAGNTDYVALRNRRPAQRTLTRIDQRKQRFVEAAQGQAREAESKAKDSLEAAQARVDKQLDALKNDKSLDRNRLEAQLRMLQESESRKLALEEKAINRERDEAIRRSKIEMEQNVREIEAGVRAWAWTLPWLPAIFLGLLMFGRKWLTEDQGIAAERLVRR